MYGVRAFFYLVSKEMILTPGAPTTDHAIESKAVRNTEKDSSFARMRCLSTQGGRGGSGFLLLTCFA